MESAHRFTGKFSELLGKFKITWWREICGHRVSKLEFEILKALNHHAKPLLVMQISIALGDKYPDEKIHHALQHMLATKPTLVEKKLITFGKVDFPHWTLTENTRLYFL